MSQTVDNKVVEMRFDNDQFEKGVATSMSTIDKLKAKLNFQDADKSLSSLSDSAKRVDMSTLANSVQKVSLQFSSLQVIAGTALANITNNAVNTGRKILSALTINPVKDGMSEYETQMNAVQTILANTQKEGTNVKIVNKYLDELNTYADKTIYNFTEMTRNIGTFTAAGVLDYARYRIIATEESTGAVSFYDPPGYPINGPYIILQWDEEWSSFDTNNSDTMVDPPWAGSLLKLLYNVDVSESTNPDVELVEYIGRKNPVSYYGTQIGTSATWNVDVLKSDKETIYQLRRIQRWMGDVYVREPSGVGYWANIKVRRKG